MASEVKDKVAEDAKADAIKKAVNKKGKGKTKGDKKSGKTAEPKTPRRTIDSVTMEKLSHPITLDNLHKELCKEFPDHDKDVLLHTTKRRLQGYLHRKCGVKIVKNDDGQYHIVRSAKAA